MFVSKGYNCSKIKKSVTVIIPYFAIIENSILNEVYTNNLYNPVKTRLFRIDDYFYMYSF